MVLMFEKLDPSNAEWEVSQVDAEERLEWLDCGLDSAVFESQQEQEIY
jgi:hypothetical protein